MGKVIKRVSGEKPRDSRGECGRRNCWQRLSKGRIRGEEDGTITRRR